MKTEFEFQLLLSPSRFFCLSQNLDLFDRSKIWSAFSGKKTDKTFDLGVGVGVSGWVTESFRVEWESWVWFSLGAVLVAILVDGAVLSKNVDNRFNPRSFHLLCRLPWRIIFRKVYPGVGGTDKLHLIHLEPSKRCELPNSTFHTPSHPLPPSAY